MINIVVTDGKAILTEEPSTDGPLFLQDYDNHLRAFNKHRTIQYNIPNYLKVHHLKKLLDKYPDAHIRRIVSHEPVLVPGLNDELISTFQLVQNSDGSPYVDDFGCHVYVHTTLAFMEAADADLREDPEPEIINL